VGCLVGDVAGQVGARLFSWGCGWSGRGVGCLAGGVAA
jgi:hypothetical protein